MSKLIVVKNVLGTFATNCYTVVNADTREAIIIDPADRGDYLINMYKTQNYKPVAVLLTHGHLDHIGALKEIREAYPSIKVYAGMDEKQVLESTKLNLSEAFGDPFTEEADIYVKDNEMIELIGKDIKCLAVPGHTVGGMCYYIEEDAILFSGDTLFCGSVGRSDFPTGDPDALISNIEKKLFTLPEEVEVYPGHDAKTTIKREKMSNPFF